MSQTTARVILAVLITALFTVGCFIHVHNGIFGVTLLTPALLMCFAMACGIIALIVALIALIMIALGE